MQAVCPICNKTSDQPYLCESCDLLLPPDFSINYFDLISVPAQFSLDSAQIEEGYENLIVAVHPDLFEQKGAEQKSRGMSWSSLAKQARDTLLHPQKRAEYIFQQKFKDAGKELPQPDRNFIIGMFELNDALENETSADTAVVKQANDDCEKFETRCAKIFNKLAGSDNPQEYRKECEHLLGEFKFWINIREIIERLKTEHE